MSLSRPSSSLAHAPSPSVWRDSPARYGRITRMLHWAMAGLLLWQLGGMVAKVTLGRQAPLTAWLSSAHQDVGLLLLVLAVVRVLWALAQRVQRPAQARGLWGVAAHLGHAGLYALMLLVPALAALRMWGNDRAYAWFGLWTLNPGGGPKVEWMTAPASALHGLLGWTLGALIVGHVAMVLVHRWVWRDGVAARMLGPVQTSAPPDSAP